MVTSELSVTNRDFLVVATGLNDCGFYLMPDVSYDLVLAVSRAEEWWCPTEV